jgi:hypothetical protein
MPKREIVGVYLTSVVKRAGGHFISVIVQGKTLLLL